MWKSLKNIVQRKEKSNNHKVGKEEKGLYIVCQSPKVILFDFGSVIRIKNSKRKQVIASLRKDVEQKAKELGLNLDFPEEDKKFTKYLKPSTWKDTVKKGLLSREEGWFNGFVELGYPMDTDEQKDWARAIIKRLDFDGKEVLPELYELLSELKSLKGVHLAILSNHSLELYDWLENKYNLIPDYFDKSNVIVSAKIKCKKPEPEAYQAAFDMCVENVAGFSQEYHASHVLFIDNKDKNCEAAAEQGMRVLHYLHDPSDDAKSFEIMKSAILKHIALKH